MYYCKKFCITKKKKKQRTSSIEDKDFIDEEDEFNVESQYNYIKNIINDMPDSIHKRSFELLLKHNGSYKEVAAILNLQEVTIRGHVCRFLKKVRIKTGTSTPHSTKLFGDKKKVAKKKRVEKNISTNGLYFYLYKHNKFIKKFNTLEEAIEFRNQWKIETI